MFFYFFFFFQAEDGIRDLYVTGVQTCALPIYARRLGSQVGHGRVQGDRDPRGQDGPCRAERGRNPARGGEQLVDLRLGVAGPATDEERDAVASVLGPPETAWEGGERAAGDG